MKNTQAISRTTGPNMGLFILILMHFPCWFNMGSVFYNSEIFEKWLKKLKCRLSSILNNSMELNN